MSYLASTYCTDAELGNKNIGILNILQSICFSQQVVIFNPALISNTLFHGCLLKKRRVGGAMMDGSVPWLLLQLLHTPYNRPIISSSQHTHDSICCRTYLVSVVFCRFYTRTISSVKNMIQDTGRIVFPATLVENS